MRNRSVKMLKKNNHISIVIAVLVAMIANSHIPGNKSDKQRDGLQLMFYNAENFFDTLDSPLDDDEFLPESARKWNSYKYYHKLNNIFRVVVLCSDGMETPDIIGLCEIENSAVLHDLCEKTYLKREGYEYLVADGKDERGINTALIYRREKLELLSSESWCPSDSLGGYMLTRAILYSSFRHGRDTLDIIICHWPSRRGGAISSDKRRKTVASFIRDKVDSIGTGRKIIIMGDMNDEPCSESVRDVLGASCSMDNGEGGTLVNTHVPGKQGPGTYKYRGTWYAFDQIILSSGLYDAGSGLSYERESFRIVDNDALLRDDNSYKGYRPFGTWYGYDYQGGYSDHLPVTAVLSYR
ncbi:MAG: endonuclease/exonuclease/phosphatase family protein [Bacteroidota bacterium]